MSTKSSFDDLARRAFAAASRGLLVLLAYSIAALATGFRNGIPDSAPTGHTILEEGFWLAFFSPIFFPLGLSQFFSELLGALNLREDSIVLSLLEQVALLGPYALYALLIPAAMLAKKRWHLIALTIVLLALLAVTAAGCERVNLMPL
jgi:hypothetical protein